LGPASEWMAGPFSFGNRYTLPPELGTGSTRSYSMTSA
jgi:hypothetical protein